MASVKDNLIAARALIDTPEKYAANPRLGMVGNALAFDLHEALKEFEPPFDGWWGPHWQVTPDDHLAMMALFDRAIAAQDGAS